MCVCVCVCVCICSLQSLHWWNKCTSGLYHTCVCVCVCVCVFAAIGLFIVIFTGSLVVGVSMGFAAAYVFRTKWFYDKEDSILETCIAVRDTNTHTHTHTHINEQNTNEKEDQNSKVCIAVRVRHTHDSASTLQDMSVCVCTCARVCYRWCLR